MVKRPLIATAALVACLGAGPGVVPRGAAQSLPATTVALYPAEAGEVVYADLRTLRQSPHYAQLRAQVFPERLRQLEEFAGALGIDLETQAQQMSWAFVREPQGVTLLSVIEGGFSPATVLERARASKLAVVESSGASLFNAGKNDRGDEFVFTLPDAAMLVFGNRTAVEALLARRSEGRGGLSESSVLAPLVAEKNGHSAVWAALDQPFTEMALRQMAPSVAAQPQAQTLLAAVTASTIDLSLTRDFAGHATLHCRGAQEAQLLAAVVQAGVSLAASQASEKTPDLAAALRTGTVELAGDRVEAKLNLPETQISALLDKNALKF